MENVQKETFGRTLKGTNDILMGYVLSEVRINDQSVIDKSGTDVHPILKATGNNLDKVEGTIFEVSKEEINQADGYEVEEYTRIEAKFQSGQIAWVYADATQIERN